MTDRPQVRVGDVEREAAAAALGEHFAAGRLTHVEYDERSERVWSARVWNDLDELFTDLPAPGPRPRPPMERASPERRRPVGWRPHPVHVVGLLLPVLIVAAVLTVIVGAGRAPWPLFVIGWLWFVGFPRRLHRLQQRD